jgi:hypothetical protein
MPMTDPWVSSSVRRLLERKTAARHKPAFLFLGRREADLLRDHLGAAFRPDSVQTLRNLHDMGLEVIELDTWSFLRTVGNKRVEIFRAWRGRFPTWNDITVGVSLAIPRATRPTLDRGTHGLPFGFPRTHPCKAENPM